MSPSLNIDYPNIIFSAGCCPSYWVCNNMQTAAHDQVSPWGGRIWQVHIWSKSCDYLDPLTTDDAFWHRQFLATCYQLAQSVLKIGSALAERVGQGEVGGCTALGESAWQLLQPWSMPSGPFVCLLAQTGIENAPFTLYRLNFWHFRQLLVRRSILWSGGPDYWTLWLTVHGAIAVDCRKALVNARWAICLPSCTNGRRKCSFHLVGTSFLAF